jgi:DNA/RNA non-specific endonuclease
LDAAGVFVEPVFNIEVDGDHVYRVGEQGLLVHNQSAPCGCTLFDADFETNHPDKKYYWPLTRIMGGPLSGQERATRGQARYSNQQDLAKGTPAAQVIILAGWVADLNVGGTRIARGHLIGKQLGGSGDVRTNLVPICQQTVNLDMSTQIEGRIATWVRGGDLIDYEVEPQYSGPSSAVPYAIKITYTRYTPSTMACDRPAFLWFPAEQNLTNCTPTTPPGHRRAPL